jgi:hypothetical protein
MGEGPVMLNVASRMVALPCKSQHVVIIHLGLWASLNCQTCRALRIQRIRTTERNIAVARKTQTPSKPAAAWREWQRLYVTVKYNIEISSKTFSPILSKIMKTEKKQASF